MTQPRIDMIHPYDIIHPLPINAPSSYGHTLTLTPPLPFHHINTHHILQALTETQLTRLLRDEMALEAMVTAIAGVESMASLLV